MFRESKLTLILRRDIRIFHAWKIKITRHGQAKPLTIFERINNQPTNQPTNKQTNTSKPAHKLFTCSRKKNFNHITITPIMFFFRYPKTTHLPKKKHHLFHPAHPPPRFPGSPSICGKGAKLRTFFVARRATSTPETTEQFQSWPWKPVRSIQGGPLPVISRVITPISGIITPVTYSYGNL